jgi:hypothetical protein
LRQQNVQVDKVGFAEFPAWMLIEWGGLLCLNFSVVLWLIIADYSKYTV